MLWTVLNALVTVNRHAVRQFRPDGQNLLESIQNILGLRLLANRVADDFTAV